MVYGLREKTGLSVDNFKWIFFLHFEVVKSFKETFLQTTWKAPASLGEDAVHNSIVGHQDHSGDVRGCKKPKKCSLSE